MFVSCLRTNFNLLKYSYSVKKKFVEKFSNQETLTTVKLSFVAYETARNVQYNPSFVILHGLFGSKQNWNSLCKVYQQKSNPPRKIIALDLRNHGDSPHSDEHSYAHLAADIKQFLDDNDIGKIALMGHSMGGRTAMLFAVKYPELVEKLIIVDISPVTTSPHLGHMPVLLKTMNRIQMPKDVPLSQARHLVDTQLAESVSDKDLRAFLLTNLVPTDDKSYKWRINIPALLKNYKNMARFPSINDMQYKGPTFFVGGGNSDFIGKSDYPKIVKLFPNAELEYIDGAGHWVHSEKPHEFLKVTLDFLNKKVPSGNQ